MKCIGLIHDGFIEGKVKQWSSEEQEELESEGIHAETLV